MTQIVSRFEEVIAQVRPTLTANTATAHALYQHGLWERVAVNDGFIESADRFVRLDNGEEVRTPYSASRFEDLRCPVCGGLGCGGC